MYLQEPHFPIEIFEMMYDISLFLIVDDKHDLGHFGYINRDDHYYRFKPSPNHPSPFHHWQVGVIGLFLSQTGALISKALEIKNSMRAQEEPLNITYMQKKKPQLPQPLPQQKPSNVYSRLVKAIGN